MKLLTKSEYDSRLAELTEAKGQAETGHRRACLAREIGSGTDDDVEKAKTHLDLLEGRISGLHSAWQESEGQAAAQRVAAEQDDYASLVREMTGLLDTRARSVAAMRRAAATIATSMKEFDAATDSLRLRGMASRRGVNADGFLMSWQTSLQSGAIVGTFLRDSGVNPGAIGHNDLSTAQVSSREERFSEDVHAFVYRLDPARDEPPLTPQQREAAINASMYTAHAAGASPVSGFAGEGGE